MRPSGWLTALILAFSWIGVALAYPAAAHAQRKSWQDREYGVGVVKYAAMSHYSAKDVIRARPSPSADTIARLDGASLCFQVPPHCVRSFDRMIEYAYEIPGWAIVGFNADSTWVKVTLDPSEGSGVTGWIKLQRDSIEAVLWPAILPRHPVFFIRPTEIAFYRSPADSSRVGRRLVESSSSREFDYIMKPLEVEGAWLKVELFSPSAMCVFPQPKVVPDTLWIQYLTPERRPKVFFYTRGC